MSGDPNVERSKLLNRQKAEKTAAQKEMKKKRGELLEAAQKKFEEMEARHERELREFDAAHGIGGGAGGKAKDAGAHKAKFMTVAQARDMSKKELEEACSERGLSKKGSREDILMRLIVWIQEHEDEAAEEKEEPKPVPMKAEKKEESDDESDSDGGSGSSWLVEKDPNAPAEGKKETKARPARSAAGRGGRGRRGGRGHLRLRDHRAPRPGAGKARARAPAPGGDPGA